MKITEIAVFEVVRQQLTWPWIAIDPTGRHFAYPSSRSTISSRTLDGDRLVDGPTFELAPDLVLPIEPPRAELVRDERAGVLAFALAPGAESVAWTGNVDRSSVLVTSGKDGAAHRTTLDSLVGPGFVGLAVAFDRSGARLWLSAESESETIIASVDAMSHRLLGLAKSPSFPPPATHELFVHPREDAVLLLAACGPEGTFGRVVRGEAESVKAVWTSLDGGGLSAGMVGFSADGARVFLAEADELRAHVWPGLKELSSTPFEDDFVSSYTGIVVGGRVLVDGQDAESRADAVTIFDETATKGSFVLPPVPSGMWAGRLGERLLVTVEAKGEPLRGRVVRIDAE